MQEQMASQLACGAALAARSRLMANTMTADTDRCSPFMVFAY